AYNTYEEMYKDLREDKIGLALMNTDIAAYEQLEWNKGRPRYERIAVLKTLPIQASIKMPFMGDMVLTNNDLCLGRFQTAAIDIATRKHRRKIMVTPVYMEPLETLLSEASVFRLMLMMAGGMIGAGILFDIARYFYGQYRKQSKSENGKEIFQNDDLNEPNEEMVLVPKRQLVEFHNEISSLKRVLAHVTE
uniref:Uncharacterized protein n=1 Tax=Clytia hemisphaerica TaxID=252671 RepID=A0A7M5USH4_9CNID